MYSFMLHVSECVCIYMYVCIFACTCVCTYIHAYVRTCILTHALTYTTHAHTHMHTSIQIRGVARILEKWGQRRKIGTRSAVNFFLHGKPRPLY